MTRVAWAVRIAPPSGARSHPPAPQAVHPGTARSAHRPPWTLPDPGTSLATRSPAKAAVAPSPGWWRRPPTTPRPPTFLFAPFLTPPDWSGTVRNAKVRPQVGRHALR